MLFEDPEGELKAFRREIAEVAEREKSGELGTADFLPEPGAVGEFRPEDLTEQDRKIYELTTNGNVTQEDIEEYLAEIKEITRQRSSGTLLGSREIFSAFIKNKIDALFLERAAEQTKREREKET